MKGLKTGKEMYFDLLNKEIESIVDIENKICSLGDKVFSNEEATKQGLILPFLKLLGFNYINVDEVIPEYGIKDNGKYDFVENSSYSNKKLMDDDLRASLKLNEEKKLLEVNKVEGELGKVDYLLPIDDVYHLLEAKKLNRNLLKSIGQLKSYFDNLEGSKLGILTDGNYYLFFTDKTKSSYMDCKPFLTISMLNNFRSRKTEVISNLYKYTRFSKSYVERKISEMDSSYINNYNKVMKDLSDLYTDNLLSSNEWEGLMFLLE